MSNKTTNEEKKAKALLKEMGCKKIVEGYTNGTYYFNGVTKHDVLVHISLNYSPDDEDLEQFEDE